jgi:hypothetical protein
MKARYHLLPGLAAVLICAMSTGDLLGQGYKTMTQLEEEMQAIADGAHGCAELITLEDGDGHTIVTDGLDAVAGDIKRRFMYSLVASSTYGTEKFCILITANFHAREWVAYRTVLRDMKFILDNKTRGNNYANLPDAGRFDKLAAMANTASIKNLLKDAEICTVPMGNPEGYQFSKANDAASPPPKGDGWRKSRRDTTPAAWAANTAYTVGKYVRPTVAGDTMYRCTQAGNSAAAEPTWPATGTVNDGTVVWTAVRADLVLLPELLTPIVPGVNLARNFPDIDWSDVGVATSRHREDDNYCGRPVTAPWPATGPPPPIPGVLENEIAGIVWLASGQVHPKPNCVIDVHSYGGYVGVPDTFDNANNLRPDWKKPGAGGVVIDDETVMKSLATTAYEMIIDPTTSDPYRLWTLYPTSGDATNWGYMTLNAKKSLSFLIEVGWEEDWPPTKNGFRPANPDAHADKVLPGLLYMMFATVDTSMGRAPAAKFKKP